METLDRALTLDERALLHAMVPPGIVPAEIRDQAAHARVTGECDCGCGTIHLVVDRTRATPGEESTLWVVQASIPGSGADEVLLFVRDGWLSSLEVVWYDNPRPLPKANEIDLVRQSRD